VRIVVKPGLRRARTRFGRATGRGQEGIDGSGVLQSSCLGKPRGDALCDDDAWNHLVWLVVTSRPPATRTIYRRWLYSRTIARMGVPRSLRSQQSETTKA